MKYFLIGIKGTGMSALASLLKDFNYEVCGSDEETLYFTEETLKEKNISVYAFGEFEFTDEYIYIIGNAYDRNHSEVAKIIEKQFVYYYYHEFIGQVLKMHTIAISGTHGKTTTTSFLTQMLEYKTSYIIGDGSGKGYTKNDMLVLEACEYKNHFLSYMPSILLINNIEMDHPDFFKNIKEVFDSFQQLANQSDLVVVNGDDPYASQIKAKNKITIGQKPQNDVQIRIESEDNIGYDVTLSYLDTLYSFRVPFKGVHMVYDMACAYFLCLLIGETPNLRYIQLPKRRMSEIKYGKTILVDDYGHHPTEIRCLYQSLKSKYPDYPIYAIFQPHTYSRTLRLKKEFKEVLSLFDEAYLANVFTSKREGESIYKQLKVNKIFKDFRRFSPTIMDLIDKTKREIWVFLGAGTIDDYLKIIPKNEE